MNDNYSYLIIPFKEFEKQVEIAVAKGKELMKTAQTQEALKDFEAAKNQWVAETKEHYESAFAEKINWFTTQFRLTGKPAKSSYQLYWDAFKAYNEEIRLKCYYMDQAVRVIAVCDYIKDRENAELLSGLTLNEKASVLLEKLYHLDNESNYLAGMLLIGSGVVLKKANEGIEIAKYLEQRGWVDISHYGGQNDLYLSISTDGKVLYEEEMKRQASPSKSRTDRKDIAAMTAIFIVHGHNNEMKETVARVINRIGYEEIILHEQASKGMTVIEKFEEHSDRAQFAIILLSADDLAYPKKADASSAKLRPRQNVVFELGYFVGKLGRERVFCLYETFDNFELHSDFAGVVLVPFDAKGTWKTDLGKELQALGVAVDWNLLMK